MNDYDNLPADTTVVSMSKERYKELLDAEEFLEALRLAGVDNWDGYDYALDYFLQDKE